MATNDHRSQWTPPDRPEWVSRINDEGKCMDIRGVVPLDEASLIDSAKHATGLSDFGASDWYEPFSVLVKSMDQDAELNLLGRIRTRSEILQLLQARLQIEEAYKQNPEIENEEIREPVFIIGQGRSGTSFLVNLLAANPDNGALMQWEAMFPCPPPQRDSYHNDPRIEKAHKLIDQWNRVTPTLASMHDFSGYVPMEDCQIIALNFTAPSWFGSLGQASSYEAYMQTVSDDVVLSYHKRVLKLLQWKNPRKHWLLKDPIHLDRLETLSKIYPDARFIWPHRDPVRALASVVNLIGTVQWGRSDRPFKGGSFEYVTDASFAAGRLDKAIEALEAGILPEHQIAHIQYRDLVEDPMNAVQRMYRDLNLELSDEGRQAMEKYLIDHPRDSRPPHKFNAGSQEAIDKARRAFGRYIDYFGIPIE
jgi:Sulfotransferase family